MGDPITLIGNIATEPERRETATGLPVATFRIASTIRRYDNEAGTWSDVSTNWYTVYAYRALAENVLDSLGKGERVIVAGKLKVRSWEKDGKRGTAVDVVADAVGHDLRWGTTAFTKVNRHGDPASRDDAWGVDENAPDIDTSWVNPADNTVAMESESGVGSTEHAEPELAKTPF